MHSGTACARQLKNLGVTINRTKSTARLSSSSAIRPQPQLQHHGHICHRPVAKYNGSFCLGPGVASSIRNQQQRGIQHLVTHTHPSAPIHNHNQKLLSIVENRSKPNAYLAIFDKCRNILEEGIQPDLTTYYALIYAHERNNNLEAIWKTIEEMTESAILPDQSIFHLALKAAANQGNTMMIEKATRKMQEAGYPLTSSSYEVIIQGLCAQQALENALDLLGEMTVPVNENGDPDDNGRPTIPVRPTLSCFLPVIKLAHALHESEAAFLVIQMAETEVGLQNIPPIVILDLLGRAAEDYMVPAVEYCWEKGVVELQATPDEGTCLMILNCAAHEKVPRLAIEVIQHMGERGMRFREYHFAPLLQTFAGAGKLKSAFNVLSIMRSAGMKPTVLTATSLIRQLAGDSPGLIDDAYQCLVDMYREGKVVDVVALNVTIEACARLKDITRAVALFEKADTIGVTPDTDTYNALLSACIEDRNMAEGRKVVNKMLEREVVPNVDTYQSLIFLCLTQINYEEAFMYLEEMKSHDVIPSEQIYTSLARKLARENDPRVDLVITEMESFGYVVGKNLQEYIETGGLSGLEEIERRKMIRKDQRRRNGFRRPQ